MREEFKNNQGAIAIFDDEGVTLHNGLPADGLYTDCYCPYGSFTMMRYGILGLQFNFKTENGVYGWCCGKFDSSDKASVKNAVAFAQKANSTATEAMAVNLGEDQADKPKETTGQFTTTNGSLIAFDEDGLVLRDGLESVNTYINCYCPYGSFNKIDYGLSGVSVVFSVDGKRTSWISAGVESKDKARLKELVAYAKEANAKAPATEVVNLDEVKDDRYNAEHRMYCNSCGQVFCYTDSDLRANEKNKQMAKSLRTQAAVNTMFVSYTSGGVAGSRADSYESKIVDYNKCPHCNSTDLKEISEEEWEQQKSNSKVPVAEISPYDELKKMKELLDMGIISQEEFDAKKKDLLGL